MLTDFQVEARIFSNSKFNKVIFPACFFLALALNHALARSIISSKSTSKIKSKMAYGLKFKIADFNVPIKFML